MDKLREDEVLNNVIDSIKQYQDGGNIDNLIKSEAGIIQVLNELTKHQNRQPDDPRTVNIYGSGGRVAATYTVDNNGKYIREIANATD